MSADEGAECGVFFAFQRLLGMTLCDDEGALLVSVGRGSKGGLRLVRGRCCKSSEMLVY